MVARPMRRVLVFFLLTFLAVWVGACSDAGGPAGQLPGDDTASGDAADSGDDGPSGSAVDNSDGSDASDTSDAADSADASDPGTSPDEDEDPCDACAENEVCVDESCACEEGFLDCDQDPTNGCETSGY